MKRYAVVGVGQRAHHFVEPLMRDYRAFGELTAICDSNGPAAEAWKREWGDWGRALPVYAPGDFERMLREHRVDTVLVMCPDHLHDDYICRSLEAGCDAITEKPITTTPEKARRILDTQARTGRTCRVTLNYRYAPWNTTIKEILVSGAIGRIAAVNLRMCLGWEHGPSYFRRWHAQQEITGGLLIHKATHYLDLMNWWIGSVPKRVFARTSRHFFTPARAVEMGLTRRAGRCRDCPHETLCPFARDADVLSEPPEVEAARIQGDGYSRDLCVFRPEATIPDTMNVLVEYENGVSLNYLLAAFAAPGTDCCFYGTHGRLESGRSKPLVTPYYGDPYEVTPPKAEGGHGGGDPVLCRDLFHPDPLPDPLLRMADHHTGIWAAAIGMAANRCMQTNQAVEIRELIPGLQHPRFPLARTEPEGFRLERMRAWRDGLNENQRRRRAAGQTTPGETYSMDRKR